MTVNITSATGLLPPGVSESISSQSNATAGNPGVTAGVVVGVIFGILTIAAATFFLIRRQRVATRRRDIHDGATTQPYQAPSAIPKENTNSTDNPKSSRYFYQQAMIEKGSTSKTGSSGPLRREDMERVLEYVAGRLKRSDGKGGSVVSDSLPSYRG